MFNLIIAYLTMTLRSPLTTNTKLPIVMIRIIRQFRKVSFWCKFRSTPYVYLESYDTDAFSGDDVLEQIKDAEQKVGCAHIQSTVYEANLYFRG